jgi:uncharacterized membrane protein YfcA
MVWLPFTLALPMGAILGLLGGGGSLLAVPILTYAAGLDPRQAIATSLLVVGGASLVALVPRALQGQVRWRTGLVLGLFSMVGAYPAGLMAGSIPGDVLLSLFAALMLASGIAFLCRSKGAAEAAFVLWRVAGAGILVGSVAGLVGAGGGFLVVPLLVFWGGLPLRQATGTSLLVIALQSFAGLLGQLEHASIPFPVAGLVLVAAVLGAGAGWMLSRRMSNQRLRTAFAALAIAIGALMLVHHLPLALLPHT